MNNIFRSFAAGPYRTGYTPYIDQALQNTRPVGLLGRVPAAPVSGLLGPSARSGLRHETTVYEIPTIPEQPGVSAPSKIGNHNSSSHASESARGSFDAIAQGLLSAAPYFFAAGAPSLDPGAGQRGIAQGIAAFGDSVQGAQLRQAQEAARDRLLSQTSLSPLQRASITAMEPSQAIATLGQYAFTPQEGAERFETVQDPFGLGGVGQQNTQTGEVINYQSAPARENPYAFGGTDQELQAFNALNAFTQAARSGQDVPPELRSQAMGAWSMLSRESYQQLPDGSTIRRPGYDLRGFENPHGGRGSAGAVLTPPEAGSTPVADTASPYLVEPENVRAAQEALPSVIDNANTMIGQIEGLLSHPGMSAVIGSPEGFSGIAGQFDIPLPGTEAAGFVARQRQLSGQAFLQAYEQLRGGGQITENEGRRAEDAISRLSVVQQSEEEYREAANELIGIIRRGVRRAHESAGMEVPQQWQSTSSGITPPPSRTSPQVGVPLSQFSTSDSYRLPTGETFTGSELQDFALREGMSMEQVLGAVSRVQGPGIMPQGGAF